VVVVIAPLLEVVALGPGDVAGAHEGGAHRLLVVAEPADDGLTPDAQAVRAIRRESPLPVRALLRAKSGFSTSGSEMSKLQGAAQELLAAGVDGFAFGFLTPANDVDIDACLVLLQSTDGLPWTFYRAIDYAFDHNRAWRELSTLPGLDTVLTAGSARGVAEGLDDLTARAMRDPVAAPLAMVGDALTPEHVPWLARAGIAKFHLGDQVRPGRSWKAYVDPQLVRSWRILLDHEVAAAS
jgi:copper homeostasis protein